MTAERRPPARPSRRSVLAGLSGLAGLAGLGPAPAARAQGFAGLGSAAEGFEVPRRGRALAFPRDHFAHPRFRIEWWYLTANLETAEGIACGVQWTLFRSALAPGDNAESPGQIWFAHAALTLPDRHLFAERSARGGLGQAGLARPFAAFIDDWRLATRLPPDGAEDPMQALHVAARGADFAYALDLDAEGPLVLHGEDGYSVKSAAGQASYYYSQPFLRARGRLDLPERSLDVTGHAWIDREWSSQPLAADQRGWDWFSLTFESGDRLMGFGLRSTGGAHFTSATWIGPDGVSRSYGDGALRLTPLDYGRVAGRRLPLRWRLALPAEGVEVETRPVNPDAWMGTSFAYWEGPVTVSGSHRGAGYLEMTGYDAAPAE
ncbi:lipocalin-like domain-containing protein [Roseivivax sp. CAU 1761]